MNNGESFLTGIIIALAIMLVLNYAIGRARNISLKHVIKDKKIICRYKIDKILKVENVVSNTFTYNVIGDVYSNKTECFERSFRITDCDSYIEAKVRALEFFIKLNHDITILKDET